MRLIRRWSASAVKTCLLLSVVSAASVWLNTDFHAPPRFDGAGYAVLGEALHRAGDIEKSVSRHLPGTLISLRGILSRLRSCGRSRVVRSRPPMSFLRAAPWLRCSWRGDGFARCIDPRRPWSSRPPLR